MTGDWYQNGAIWRWDGSERDFSEYNAQPYWQTVTTTTNLPAAAITMGFDPASGQDVNISSVWLPPPQSQQYQPPPAEQHDYPSVEQPSRLISLE